MTPRTLDSIKESIANSWQAAFGDSTPAEVYGSQAVVGFPAWCQATIGPKPRLSRMDCYHLAKAVNERCKGLKNAEAMLKRPPLGGVPRLSDSLFDFEPGSEG